MSVAKRLSLLLGRSLRLRCPCCGKGRLFRRGLTMHERCSTCGLVFEQEQGYFVGAIYINYAATAALTIGGYLLLDTYTELSLRALMILGVGVAVVFPLAFFRHSKSFWLALDFLFNPQRPPLRLVHGS